MESHLQTHHGRIPCIYGRNSIPPLEDAPRPHGPAVVENLNHGNHPHIQEGIGESENHQGPPRPRPSYSSGSRLRAAGLRGVEELPQNPGGNQPGDSGSVQAGGQARGGPIAQRTEVPRAAGSAVSIEEARTLMERMVSLERKLTGDVAGLKKNIGRVAEVVNVDITPSRTHDHPFTAEIMAPPLPDKYRSPSIPPYDGRGDPDDHLEMYTGHMLLHGYAEEIMCRAFRNHLTDSARRWFRTLKPNSISSWDELKEAFSLQFIGVKKYVPPKQNLTTIYQKPNETLREWLARYGEAVTATMDITDREALMGALSSMKKITPFKRELNRIPPSSYKEFLARAQGYINAEEADANDPDHRSNKGKGAEQGSAPSKQDEKKRRGGGSGDKQPTPTQGTPEAKKPRQEDARRPRLFQKYDTYHELMVGVEEIYNQVGRGNLLRRPEPIKSDPSRRNPKKFCRFHGDVGHHTNDYADLKDEIERIIREGRLQEFRAERRPRNDGHGGQNDGRRQEENHRPEDREPVGVIRTVLGGPYIGGDMRRSQKDYAHEAKGVYQERFWSVSAAKTPKHSHTDVAFNEDNASGVHFPHNDALVVEAMIGNHTVCRILVDNGSSVDLLYSDCLEKMGIHKGWLERTSRPLYGFTGDSVIPQGTIRLLITAGEKPRQATTMANFVVIKGGSQYNAVIGRPTL
ncbi:uncharacterized protein LOC112093363 [Morus notabilis]|uniref:uncharacterized protein LOC112093363 n=1 Tax=Morus notabilis TaxID=981085 RepID=UPI000CED68AE|nr:uncharacterized protein LOC112093363 [Morus notabilis]